MKTTRLIFVGGFLGAGKTTLLFEIARLLTQRGLNVGLITNDQAPDLADTAILSHTSLKVAEVAGSCFCCDFNGLKRSIESLGNNQKPDVILAEPVGSCTDLSATIINPCKDILKTEVTVSPLTVLIDPVRLKEIIDGTGSLHPSAAYIIKKQLEESDIIAITKTDQYTQGEINQISDSLKRDFPECEIRSLSSKTGEGLEAWLDFVLTSGDSGKHIVEIDYDKYAEGEAVLGWLNCSATLSGKNVDWDAFARSLMQDISQKTDSKNLAVGHVKMVIENGDQYISTNLTGKSDTLNFRWSAGTSDTAEMIFNARVEMSPQELEDMFKQTLDAVAGKNIRVKIKRLRSLSPGRPDPTHRYSSVVGK